MGLGSLVKKVLTGGAGGVAGTVERVGGVFKPNAERDAVRASERFDTVQGTYSKEKVGGGWFNQFVNGLNRLPRPVLALGTVGLFVYAMYEPVGFAERMVALDLIPDELWWLLGSIVAFYFGAREMHYFRKRKPVQTVVEQIRQIRELRFDDIGAATDDDPETHQELSGGTSENAAVSEFEKSAK